MYYYVDFENVACAGLKGIANLKNSDIVTIYYSNNPNMDIETVKLLLNCKAKIQFEKLADEIKSMNTKNALDIVILNDISRIIADKSKEMFIVISNDTGYDTMIQKFCQDNKKIARASCISKAPSSVGNSSAVTVTKNKIDNSALIDEQAIIKLFSGDLKEFFPYRHVIVDVVKKSKTRCEINNSLNKQFGQKSSKLMKGLKPYIKNIKGS
ncbi:MAG TPA: hypothetical protein DCO72_05500 [Ruminococcus sp.]|nr:hypothetical protein [Ruminococcus sp.]